MQEIYAIGTDDRKYRAFVGQRGSWDPVYTPGSPCLRQWNAPRVRDYQVRGKTLEIGDVSTYFYPAFTARAQESLAPLFGDWVEWLPVMHEDGSQHFCLNVVELRSYFLPGKSKCARSRKCGGIIVGVERYCFASKPRVYSKPLLFTCPEIKFAQLATKPMADAIKKLNLRGLTVDLVWSA